MYKISLTLVVFLSCFGTVKIFKHVAVYETSTADLKRECLEIEILRQK
jgi:hypothetical protein